jgi:hypothetical protein
MVKTFSVSYVDSTLGSLGAIFNMVNCKFNSKAGA